MKKKIILVLVIIFLSFVFFIFYKSLYKKNYYVPQNISEKIISFKAKNLYTNNYLNSDQLLLDKIVEFCEISQYYMNFEFIILKK